MPLMRLKFLLIVLLIAFTLLLSCRTGTGNRSRLLIYTPHGQDLLKDFIARYKQRYPDADLQFLDMGSRQILERVRVERNRPQADLWWGASHMTFQTAADENLLAEFRPGWADQVAVGSRDDKSRWFG